MTNYPARYIPNVLSRLDKLTQKSELDESRQAYKEIKKSGGYYNAKDIESHLFVVN